MSKPNITQNANKNLENLIVGTEFAINLIKDNIQAVSYTHLILVNWTAKIPVG